MLDYYHATRPDNRRKPRPVLRLLSDIGYLLAGPFIVWMIAVGIGAALAPVIGGASPLLTLLILIALALWFRNARRARAMIALNYIEQAVRLNLPIPAMLRAAEEAERGKLRNRLRRLRDHLESGWFVGPALERSMPGTPQRVVQLVTASERVGGLSKTLGRLVGQQESAVDRRPAQSIMLRWYPMLMLLCIAPLFAIVMIFVMPKFKAIFHDFRIPLPPETVWLLNFWDAVQIPVVIASAIVIFVFCGRMLSELLPNRTPPFRSFRVLTDALSWRIPPWRGVVRNRTLADVCHVLADAIGAGQPIDHALFEAAEAADNRVLRKRLGQWGKLVSTGVPLADAARQAKLPALIAGMIRTAQGPEGLKDVFAFLARYYDSQFSAAAAILQGAAIPLMVLVMAVFVTTLALGLFVPLVELINHLAPAKGMM